MKKMFNFDWCTFTFYCVLCLNCFSYAQFDADGTREGDQCYNLSKQQWGTCTNYRNCPEALRDFRNGVRPKICSYFGNDPIICCAQPQYSTPEMKHTNHRKSLERCDAYRKLTVERNIVGSFSLEEQTSNTVERTKCSVTGGGGFILGGTVTNPGEFPHMALIGHKFGENNIEWFCGGSLISYYYILTAAHCFNRVRTPVNIVRLGEQNVKRTDEGALEEDYTVEKIVKHPKYLQSSKYYDVAVIKLGRRVRVNNFVRPACLWQTYDFNTTNTIATGWGFTAHRSGTSDDLKKVSLKLISNQKCQDIFGRRLPMGIMDSQMCAGDDEQARNTCNGDSGEE